MPGSLTARCSATEASERCIREAGHEGAHLWEVVAAMLRRDLLEQMGLADSYYDEFLQIERLRDARRASYVEHAREVQSAIDRALTVFVLDHDRFPDVEEVEAIIASSWAVRPSP